MHPAGEAARSGSGKCGARAARARRGSDPGEQNKAEAGGEEPGRHGRGRGAS